MLYSTYYYERNLNFSFSFLTFHQHLDYINIKQISYDYVRISWYSHATTLFSELLSRWNNMTRVKIMIIYLFRWLLRRFLPFKNIIFIRYSVGDCLCIIRPDPGGTTPPPPPILLSGFFQWKMLNNYKVASRGLKKFLKPFSKATVASFQWFLKAFDWFLTLMDKCNEKQTAIGWSSFSRLQFLGCQ